MHFRDVKVDQKQIIVINMGLSLDQQMFVVSLQTKSIEDRFGCKSHDTSPIDDGTFQGCLRHPKKAPLPKLCHTYPNMLKLGSYTLAKEKPEIYNAT